MAIMAMLLNAFVFLVTFLSCSGALHVEKDISRVIRSAKAYNEHINMTHINTVSGAKKMMYNKCCPTMCTCDESGDRIAHRKTFTIRDCLTNPTVELDKLLSKFCHFHSYRIVRANLLSLPCKLLSGIYSEHIYEIADYIYELDVSENAIRVSFCDNLKLKNLLYLNVSHNNLDKEPIPLNISVWLRDIDFSYNKMTSIPCSIGDIQLLKRLDLSYNLIKTVPCNMTGMFLRIINMTHNQLQTFPCNLSTLTRLLHLNLSYNHIETISCNTLNLPDLLDLDLSYNHVQNIHCELLVLSGLKSLNLSHNHIQAMNCRYPSLSALQELYLNNNHLKTVPGQLGSLPALKRLDLSWNYLKVVSCELFMYPTLEWIWMRHNLLEDMKCKLSKMTELYALDLSHNRFATMPCNLSPQKKVRYLDFSYNQIHRVPCTLWDIKWDLVLNLTYNQMLTFPCNLTTFSGDTLDLSHNKMDTVDCKFSNICRPKGALYHLNMSYNVFQTIPFELTSHWFMSIDMSHNEIQTVPYDLPDLFVLNLNLNNNNLGPIPCSVSLLRFVNELYLNNNHIITLPPFCFNNMSSLTSLHLDSNEISTLVNESFSRLDLLANISLKNNKLSIIESGVFCHRLNEVHLENNNLEILDSWPRIHNDRQHFPSPIFYVSNNKLSTFTNSARSPLASCLNPPYNSDGLFYIDGNNIHHIMDVFNGWNLKVNNSDEIDSCLMLFDFTNNPLVCDCIDYDIYRVIQGYNSAHLSKNLTCNEPASLKGLNPAFVPLNRFVCNVSEKCPEGCLCYDTPHSRNLSVICTAYEKTGFPDELPGQPGYSYYLKWTKTRLETVSYRPYLTHITEAIFSSNVIKNVTLDALLSLGNVSKLYLDNNSIKHFPDNITFVTLGPGVELRLGNNPWVCDCKAVTMKEWLVKNHGHILDLNNVRCFWPPNVRDKQIIGVDNSVMCPPQSKPSPVLAILGGIISFFVICLPLLCVIKVKRAVRGHERIDWKPVDWDEEVYEGKEFDVFVSYANEDEEYVGEYLIPELENHGFKVCFHRVHFLAGKNIIDNICECIAKSKKMLAFYSMNYKDSDFGMYEFTMAMQLDIEKGTTCLITIKDTDLDVENLQISHSTYFRTTSYIIKEEPNFWRTLLYALPKHKLGDVEEENQEEQEDQL